MTDAALVIDRIVSASSATDAHDSLQALLDGLKSRDEQSKIDGESIWQDATLLGALLQIVTSGSYKEMSLEEGPSLVCRIYQQLWKLQGASNILLKQPSPGIFLQSLLDVISDTSHHQTNYTRVLSLQLLHQACLKAPSLAQAQLLEIPNGLHRLADVFGEENDQVRNELLGGVAQTIGTWPSCAKIWVFGEVCDTLMEIAMQEGGLTGAHVLVSDCLNLVASLVKVDPTLADLIWQSPIVPPKLAALLDLRGGSEFLNPPKPTVSQSDDLDDILATGNQSKQQQQQQVLPKLTFQEEDLIVKVLTILGTLLENPESRPAVWKQHSPLCSLVWELALVSRPPPGTKPVCALPSPKLQQIAMETTGQYFNGGEIMKQHYGVDRLLYFACTGGGGASPKWNHTLGLSQAALYVLRQSLPEDEAREVLTHTLAPPMTSTDDDDKPPPPTVVQKLLNTVFENLQENEDTSTTKDPKHVERRRINLVGALGALSIFLKTPTDSEVLLAITSSSNLVDAILVNLQRNDEEDVVKLALLKFVSEWMVEAPSVVQAFLASSHSVQAFTMQSSNTQVTAMNGFVLGLCMQYMADGDDDKHGGWTKEGIVKILSKKRGGISGYTTSLEKLKEAPNDLPWKACDLEWKRFLKWYSGQVLVIRRCVVQQLTSSGNESDEDNDTGDNEVGTSSSHSTSIKSLNRLVSQQAAELEELRMSLSDAKTAMERQEGQLAVWKRRVESTPTQLDEMLTEYTTKNSEMEKEVSILKKQLEEKDKSIQSQLEERDGQIVQLQATVQEWQTREAETRQERDDLRSELEGLTSAYATLEQEYNNRREGPSTAAAAPTGEATDARAAQQPEGEVSHQQQSSSSSMEELATLRAENARLRSDAQAADDWMAMAVQRMNDIGGQNQALQQEVATLRQQWQQAELTGGVVAPVVTGITQEQLDAERQLRQEVEQRLAEAGTANSQLETEIAALRQQVDESTAHLVDTGVLDELKRRLVEEEHRRQELESQLQNAQRDTSTAMDSLGGSKAEKERLERTVVTMESELQSAHSEIASLREERDRFQETAVQSTNMAAAVEEKEALLASMDSQLDNMHNMIASKDEELASLRQQLTRSRETLDATDEKGQELLSLQEKVQSLTHDLERTRIELDVATSHEREEIQKRDERIRELESRPPQDLQQSRGLPSSDDAASFFDSGGADSRDEEIRSLREANQASQEWMAKAVEHHQMLSDQVSALTEDKAALTKQIEELQVAASTASESVPDASRETIDRLERELSERTTEVTDLGARIIKLESEVRIKETQMAGVQETIAKCEQLQLEVSSLEDARDVELEKAKSLEEKVSLAVSENEELSLQVESLRQKLDEKETLITDSSSDEIASLKQLLEDREAETDNLRNELEAAKDAFADADQLRITLQNAKDESSRLRTELDDSQNKVALLTERTASFERLQEELQQMREMSLRVEEDSLARQADVADMNRLRDEIASSRLELDSLTEERDNLKATVSQLESQLSEFQTWADAAQQKIAELQQERDVAAEQVGNPQTTLNKGIESMPVDGLRAEVVTLTTERDSLKETVGMLESQLSEFQSWSNAAQAKITELQNEKEAAEHELEKIVGEEGPDGSVIDGLRDEVISSKNELASLITERDELKETIGEMEKQLSEFQSWSDAAQLKIKELEDEKEAVEQEMEKLKESNEGIDNDVVYGLREEIATSKGELASVTAEREELKETIVELESQLVEFQSWSDAAQVKITELEEEKESVEQEIQKLRESSEGIDNKVVTALREEVATCKSELASLATERDELKGTIVEMESQLSEFQLWTDAAQVKIKELEEEKDSVEQETNALVQSEKAAREELDSFRGEMESNTNELSSARQDIEELKTAKADIDSLLEKTKLENENLYGKNRSLEQDVKVLETQCNELVERLKIAETLVSEKEEMLRDVEGNATELQSALESLQEESAGVVDEWKAQVEELESTVSELEEALQRQQVEASDAVEQWSTRWSELDSLKSDLERHLETISKERDDLSEMLQHERENSGKEALAKIESDHDKERAEWVAEKDRLQARIDEQNEDILVSSQNAAEANEELSRMRATAEETVEAWKHRMSEMEDTVHDLEQELAQRRDEASEAIAQWESHCSSLVARTEELEVELQAAAKEKDEVKLNMERSIEPLGEQLEEERFARLRLEKENEAALREIEEIKTQSEDVVNQWKARVQELDSLVIELEGQLEVQQEEATKAISQWETSYSALQDKMAQLEDDYAQASVQADRSLNEELRGRKEEIVSLTSQIDELQRELANRAEFEERVRELETALDTERDSLRMAEASLESKRELAENLEAELLQLRQEVERDAAETREALALERAAREEAESNLATLQDTVSETEEAFEDLRSKEELLLSAGNRSKEDSDRIQQLLETKESQWNDERENIIQERDELKAAIGELQEELRDASDALQACVTDSISEKATEVASSALRYQMEQLRSQIEREQEICATERERRLAAEKEVDNLTSDLANVLGVVEGRDDASGRLQRLTMRASETMQRREREEMDELRKALEKALMELATAQDAEAKALEDAASSRLQLSVCEQEVLAAKSDLAFLTQTLEETREAEASKAASLEYRISSLEDDRAVLRQFHQDELENLRNELTHVNMEKDRIMHSLKESEKKNAAIVFSTSKERESDGSVSPEAELSRLRVEKAQLLTAAAEEGSRTESRIREAVAAHVSSMEADIILERELRVAAEAAVEDIKFQMEELKSGFGAADDETRDQSILDDSRSESFLDELSAELKRFKEETRSLKTDNENLKRELAEAKEKSHAEIVDLTDKWRKAQAKARMLESADQFDAEVNVEVAKLRSSGGGKEPRNWIVVRDNPIEDETAGPSPVEAYDLIQQQKIAIQEERAMYLELLAEHDDLLALLAQQELEKNSLNAALTEAAGPQAVDAAMADAEENAVKQFGKYIKLAS